MSIIKPLSFPQKLDKEPHTITMCVDFMIPTNIAVANQLVSNAQFEEKIKAMLTSMLPEIRKFVKLEKIDDHLGRFNSEYVQYTLSLTLQK